MATTVTSLARPVSGVSRSVARIFHSTVFTVPVTLVSAFVLGYHPYAEDAGIYMSGVKRLLQPNLFPFHAEFVTRHTQYSVFAYLLAALSRISHLPVEWTEFSLHILSLWLIVYSSLLLARRLFPLLAMQWAAVITLALCLGTPVAGTSLYISDPYLTARSFIAPIALFAACTVLERRWLLTVFIISFSALLHPLMTIYLVAIILALAIARWMAIRLLMLLPLAGVVGSQSIKFLHHNMLESQASTKAVLTRSYFFLSEWHWYEMLGILLPILLLFTLALAMRHNLNKNTQAMMAAAMISGLTSALVSIIYVPRIDNFYLIARLQVLREFYYIYLFMFLVLGALAGGYILRQKWWRWVLYTAALSLGLFISQRSIYPASSQMQLPWQNPPNGTNQWTEAFLWIRSNTAQNAIFALDPFYISSQGEDAQGFRATAERSVLADYSKDGGAAAIFPDLANEWADEVAATTSLNTLTDTERRQKLLAYGVSWLVLSDTAVTALECPYSNNLIKVCELNKASR